MKALVAILMVFASTALGASWKSEGPYFGNVRSIAVDPANPDRLAIGTHGGGVWLSSDGGGSWTLAGKLLSSYVITFVQFQPKSGTIWAGVSGGSIARSKDGGKTWEWVLENLSQSPRPFAFDPSNPKAIWLADVNLHKRSADGGAKWTEFRISGGDALAIAFHPTNSKVIWAGGVNGRAGLWKTSDGGTSWKQMGKGLPESNRAHRIIVDAENPDTIYMAASRGGYKSVDGGDSWVPFGGGFPQSSEIESLAMSPSSSKTLYAGTEKGLFRTADGGESWRAIDNGLPNYIVTALAVHPSSPDVLWAGASAAGVYKSTDGGKSWRVSNGGLAAAWVERLWGDASGSIYVQTKLGLFRTDGRDGWSAIVQPFSDDEADVDTIVFDPKTSKTIHVGDGWSYYRSTDGGANWSKVVKPFQEPQPVFGTLALDPKNPKILYAADPNSDADEPAVFKSTDGGVKWKPASRGMTVEGVRALRSDGKGALIALGNEGGLWRSSDGAGTWTEIGDGLPADDLNGIAIDPTDSARVFVASKTGLFRSKDGGETFSTTGSDMKRVEMESVAIDDAGRIYVANLDGVFRSTDGGESFAAFSEGLTNEDVRVLDCAGSHLYAGTAGGGVFSMVLE